MGDGRPKLIPIFICAMAGRGAIITNAKNIVAKKIFFMVMTPFSIIQVIVYTALLIPEALL